MLYNESIVEKLEQEIYTYTDILILLFSTKKTACIIGSSNNSFSRRTSVWFGNQGGSWCFYIRSMYF